MTASIWFITVGFLAVSLAFATPLFQRLPLSVSTLYLVVGVLLGPVGLGLLSADVVREARLFERITEIAVIVSLFTVGLTMRRSLTDRAWQLPLRLATVSMILCIFAVAAVTWLLLDLPLGAAILLGAILAPTDPVLASDVQLQDETDQDEFRYSISGEAGLNDGTAFPFVMLGLGLLHLHPDDEAGFLHLWADGTFTIWAWIGWDLGWAVLAGLAVGAGTGWLIGHAALLLQRHLTSAFSLHEFLVLGLIALAYGLAELIYGYGFLAVFAAGFALRYIELQAADHAAEPADLPAVAVDGDNTELDEISSDKPKAAHFLAVSLRDFNEKLEHLLMVAVVILVGGVLTVDDWAIEVLWLAPLLFLFFRTLAVLIGLGGTGASRLQKGLIGWFGIRGIGSIYYLTYAIEHGLPESLAQRLTSIVLSLIVVSILIHGTSTTPLMNWYVSLKDRNKVEQAQA